MLLPLSERIAIPSASISVSTYIQWVLVFKVGILVMKLIIHISVYEALVSGVYTYIYIMDKIKLVVYIYTVEPLNVDPLKNGHRVYPDGL